MKKLDEWGRSETKRTPIVFNLTGGFKSIVGFLTAAGMFLADETFFLFESGESLMRIPRLPIQIESGIRETFQNYLPSFRRLAICDVPADECKPIPETLLLVDGDRASLSVWGETLWAAERPRIYREKVFSPPEKIIEFGPRFEESVADLTPDRVAIINERIDDLTRYMRGRLRRDQAYNPRRLDAKPLKGKPGWEADAWADQGAWRLFFDFEDRNGQEVLVLRRLGEHL